MKYNILKSRIYSFVQYGDIGGGNFIHEVLIPSIKLLNQEELCELKDITNEYYENNKFQKKDNYSEECASIVSLYIKGLEWGLTPKLS